MLEDTNPKTHRKFETVLPTRERKTLTIVFLAPEIQSGSSKVSGRRRVAELLACTTMVLLYAILS